MLFQTFRDLADAESPFGQRVVDRCAASSGLSLPMVRWALLSSLPSHPDLERVASQIQDDAEIPRRWRPPNPAALILAGNVFTACIRSMLYPLLAGVPLLVKASSRDSALPALFKEAWDKNAAGAEDAVQVMDFPGSDTSLMGSLLQQVELVTAYGSDLSLQELRKQTSIGALFVGHGHGLGVAYVPAAALPNEEEAATVAKALALDICAYDQRGCLSPHSLIVEEGGHVSPREFAQQLFQDGIGPLARELPRGKLPIEVASQQLQWRGIAASRNGLLEGDGAALSFEGTAALRLSPGWRNLQVLSCRDREDMLSRVAPLGRHLKNLGVAAFGSEQAELCRALPPELFPRVCAVGRMQTPRLDARMDGYSPWLGLRRFADYEPTPPQ